MTQSTSDDLKTPEIRRRRRDFVVLGVVFALMLVGLGGLAAATGWSETRDALFSLGALQFAILLFLSLVNYGFRGFRWHLFSRRLGLKLSAAANFRHFIGGFAMSATPGRVGELIRMRWIRRETGWEFARTAPLVLVDRAADLVAMALILAIAVPMATGMISGVLPVIMLALLAAFVVTRPALLHGVATLCYRAIGRFERSFARLRSAARSLDAFSDPLILFYAALLGMIGWFAEGYAFHLLLGWLGQDIGLWLAVATFVFSTLAGGLTGLPGGVGGAEATMIALLSLEGVPLEVSIPATLIIRVTTLWFAILLGLGVFPYAERQSLKGPNAT